METNKQLADKNNISWKQSAYFRNKIFTPYVMPCQLPFTHKLLFNDNLIYMRENVKKYKTLKYSIVHQLVQTRHLNHKC